MKILWIHHISVRTGTLVTVHINASPKNFQYPPNLPGNYVAPCQYIVFIQMKICSFC